MNAFLQVLGDRAVEAARGVDERVAAGERLPLAGVPVALKDNICVGPDLLKSGDGRGYGGRTTCASRILENYESPYTATAVDASISKCAQRSSSGSSGRSSASASAAAAIAR